MRYDPPMREVVESRALLADPRFGSLWLSQGLAQTAQNAILFSLLIVVLNITGSSIATSILVLTFILPSIPAGMLVGVILDRSPKAPVLVTSNLLRAGACVLLYFSHSNEWVIYGISAGFATSGLFFNPAVVALIPSLVPRDRLVNANSLYNFTLTGSQLVGMVFLAPAILKAAGAGPMFLTAAALFVAAALLALRLSGVREEHEPKLPQGPLFGRIPNEFRESWRTLVSDRASLLALSQLTMSSSLVLLFAILIPRYMKDTLHISPDNAAFVFAPTGIGALVGLRFLPWFARRGKNRVVVIGLLGIALCLVLLALVKPLAEVTELAPGSQSLIRFLRISLLQALTMAIAGPMGFFYALLNAPAQTVLHERAPAEMRGRIFATQVVSANFISLLPLLLIGAVTDWTSITAVLLLLAAGVSLMALASELEGRRQAIAAAAAEPPPEVPTPPPEVPTFG
ncbi:MAG: MFS transporter [Chloroflexi bacterium]|nr:MFS transporter [Chloroflexota bacterium]